MTNEYDHEWTKALNQDESILIERQNKRRFALEVWQACQQFDLKYWIQQTQDYGILEDRNLYGSVWYSHNEPNDLEYAVVESFGFWFESDPYAACGGWFLCRDLEVSQVIDLPKQINGHDIEYKSDSQDSDQIKTNYLEDIDHNDYDSFFIVDKPDCFIVWGMWGIVPYLERSIDRLI